MSSDLVADNPKGQSVQLGASRHTLKPHSIYVAAVGGSDKEIAETILRYAGSGCDFNGNTEITVYDDNYSAPKPAYQVSFMRPAELPVYFRIKVERGAALGFQTALKQAVINAFNNGQARIGATLYAIGYVQPLVQAVPDIRILDVEIGLVVDILCRNITTSEIPIGIITSFIGAPIFLYLIYKKGRDYDRG